jgi:anti-sigma regulatory factor (Ser/Thr protein kinase)
MPGADPPTAEGQITLQPVPAAVRDARHFVQHRLAALSEELLSTITLLVSELATNAVLHAHTPFAVIVRLTGDRVRIAVTDENPAVPVVKDYGVDAVTGRGMQLVAALAADWGTEPVSHGKSVWFEMAAADDLVGGSR